ncbi:8413_t:CDS:2 [Gigaspora margarita]|uniref:8413_t:CDS:1 n=1 Tax=Gigaspora margarita TaxID=4874 RepID=A0ABN7V904_GIGMA|nr:8413_t:CDS:2 [Gigaspora margarita]
MYGFRFTKKTSANNIYNKLDEWNKCIEGSGNSEIKKQFLCGDDNFIKLVKNLKGFGDCSKNIKQFFSDDILINYKFDEWIKNLEYYDNLDEWIKNLEYSDILDEWIKNLENSGNLDVTKKTVSQFFSDNTLINYKSDEWINNLETSGDLEEIIKQFLDNDKYSKESKVFRPEIRKDVLSRGLLFALIGVECDEHIKLDFQPDIDLRVTDEIDKNILGNSGNFDI